MACQELTKHRERCRNCETESHQQSAGAFRMSEKKILTNNNQSSRYLCEHSNQNRLGEHKWCGHHFVFWERWVCVCVYLAYFGWWSIYGKRAKLWLYINKTGGNGKKARPVHRWHMCNDTKNYVSPRISQTMEIECAREIKTIRIYHFAIWMQNGNGMRKRDRRRSCLGTF